MCTHLSEKVFTLKRFPLFLNYYPSSKVLHLPNDGPVAYASRAELTEATANLMMQDGYEKEIVLLTRPKAGTLADLVVAINEATGNSIFVETLPPKEYVKASAKGDEGGKGEWWFERRISWYEGAAKGDGKTVDPLMGKLLGKVPKDGRQIVKELLAADPEYTWHQNYAKK